MPIDVTFRGELLVFDKGKEINDHLPDMTINDELRHKEKAIVRSHN